MTLQARLVAVHARRYLIVGPGLDSTRVVRCLVHVVAREAGQRALVVGRILETGRFDEAVVLPSGHANHAVRPEGILDEALVLVEQTLHGGRLDVLSGLR